MQMSLTPGTKLGSYEILAAIGAGGMGEVYRARDTKLGRDVAIKALPSEVAEAPERLARFRREAHLLASLNHPHIAAIYGIEEVQERPFLILELVEGEELAQRMKRVRLPSKRHSESPGRSPRRSRRPMRKGSSTATSSLPTSS